MRVVVTGATGNVGTSVVDALLADDQVDEVVGLARRPMAARPGLRTVAADVGTDDLTAHLQGADALVHLAWMFQPTHRPRTTWQANAVGTSSLLAAAADAGVGTVVVASSVGAYSPAPGRRVEESWPTHSLPTAAYGREKAYVERVLDAFEERHRAIRVVRLRPSFIFQRRAASEQRRIFAGPFLPASVIRPPLVPVLPWPHGLQFQALHAGDVAEAYRLAVTRPDARGAYNVASEPVVDGRVVAGLLSARLLPVPGGAARAAVAALWRLHLVPADPALVHLAMSLPLLDTTRIRSELGWEPRVSGPDALREVLRGMREGAGGRTAPLVPDSPRERLHEVATGVGETNDADPGPSR